MQKEWSSFRITLLLYLIVLLLPFSFYFVYTSFKTMQQDTKIVRQSSWLSGAMGHTTDKNNPQTIKDIDNTLQNISIWAGKNSATKLYIGAHTLSEDLTKVTSCWTENRTNLSAANTKCYMLTDNLALNIEKMVYLKQKKIINTFYISLAIAMILLLLIIYMVRLYIHQQMKKHAIHDHETKLFNKQYFLSECKSSCARAVRHEYPLSMLLITINGFEKETKIQTLKALGTLIFFLVRDGDLPCRYDENKFLILLPFTQKENALLFEKRIREALMKDDCIISEKIEFDFTITEFDKKESEVAFVQRTLAS